jgi:amidase
MRFIMLLSLLLPAAALAQNAASGRWVVKADFYGTDRVFLLELQQESEQLTGHLLGGDVFGTVKGKTIDLRAVGDQNQTEHIDARLDRDTITGTLTFTSADDPGHPRRHTFKATRVETRKSGPPHRHEFIPTQFYRQFSALTPPVLTVSPGDTIHTTTVDAGGQDEKGEPRVMGGNPETGPFYVETAAPGDVLVVHLNRLRLNRDFALSDDFMVRRALDPELAAKMKDNGKSVRWHLDTVRGVATSESPGEHLKQFSVPLRPMLGCVAVAVAPQIAAPGTGDSGGYGGNMDFNEVNEGATVYLPVSVAGALLYFGDGHAAQGDGELNGNALETSMDVELTVDVIPSKGIPGPRVESETHIMAMGLAGSVDDAVRGATSNMAQWLTDEYKLNPSELAQVLGTSAEYKVSELADRNAGVVLKIRKDRLQSLK